MIIGIPKEIKEQEYRVGATPPMVRAFIEAGHEVKIQQGAGAKIGFTDEMYETAGATVVATAEDVWGSEMILKVKEPQQAEYELLQEGQILFTYLHLAPDPVQTKALIQKKVVGIAYETVTDKKGRLPLLIPMSEMAGRIAIQSGAQSMQINNGGNGLLLGGVPGVFPANVVVIGGGVVGTEAARMAMGLGANVTILDKNLDRLRTLDALYGPVLRTLFSSPTELELILSHADLVVGAVLVPGKTAPKLISKEMVRGMLPGSVLVDVAIDQGGMAETSRPTTHTDPVYLKEGVLHYCVTNMPGACARTATIALTNATMEYALTLATKGWQQAMKEDKGLLDGLNVCLGHVTNNYVAHDLGYPYVPAQEVL